MDQQENNPYATEIPVIEAEKQLNHTQSQQPDQQPPTSDPARMHSSILPKFIIALLIISIVGLSGYIIANRFLPSASPSLSPTPIPESPSPTAVPSPTPTPIVFDAVTSPDESSTRFYSTELGILFDTAKILPEGQLVNTSLSNNRVYVYIDKTAPSSGQYVEVLNKLSTDDIITAATKITKNDAKFANCTFTIVPQTSYPSTYQKASPQCQAQVGGGIEFFLTDSNHPTKLLYISIGQYAIPANNDPESLWQNTVRFISNPQPTVTAVPSQ